MTTAHVDKTPSGRPLLVIPMTMEEAVAVTAAMRGETLDTSDSTYRDWVHERIMTLWATAVVMVEQGEATPYVEPRRRPRTHKQAARPLPPSWRQRDV